MRQCAVRHTDPSPQPAAVRVPHSEENLIETDLCRLCAACCKNKPFIELSAAEIGALEAATGLHPDAFTEKKRTQPEEHFMHFGDDGHCIFLAAASGTHACSVYAARPAICRDYPWTQIQTAACDAHSEKCREKIPG
jgi:Fe-S-cluster containining protein